MRRVNPRARRKPAKPRSRKRSLLPRWIMDRLDWRLLRWPATGLAAIGLLSGLGWLWQSGWFGQQTARLMNAAYEMTADTGLAVDDVLVEGRNRTAPAAILTAVHVERGSPILAFDPHTAKTKLETLPWVRTATVERRLPDLVYVRLIEREPLAIWQLHGKLSVIDRAGQIIEGAPPELFTELPLVVGSDAPDHAAALLSVLDSEPELRIKVIAAVRVASRRWNVRLSGGIDVHLPESEPAAAWSHLAKIERQRGVLGRDVVTIDLRLPDRLIVRTTPGAEINMDEPAKGENT